MHIDLFTAPDSAALRAMSLEEMQRLSAAALITVRRHIADVWDRCDLQPTDTLRLDFSVTMPQTIYSGTHKIAINGETLSVAMERWQPTLPVIGEATTYLLTKHTQDEREDVLHEAPRYLIYGALERLHDALQEERRCMICMRYDLVHTRLSQEWL